MILDRGSSLKKSTMPPEADKPPPYTHSSHEGRVPERYISPPQATSSSRFLETPTIINDHAPPPTVNQVHLLSKKEDIIGTFYIDPLTPSLTPRRKKHGKRSNLPHASFHTRSAAISLTLGTTGDSKRAPKATVSVGSGSGNVEVTLLPTPPTRPRIGIDIVSRKGDIMLFLPDTFSGVIQLETRRGELHVLPALMQVVKVLKATDKEAMILMGSQGGGGGDSSLTDLCQLNSRTGKVIVGLSGRDKHPEKTGFWKKVVQILQGS